MDPYLPILLALTIAVVFSLLFVAMSYYFGPKRPLATKESVYECGMPPVGDARERQSVKFYLIAMIFLLFDIEVVFMYPWAVTYKDMLKTDAALVLGGMLSFLGILFVGYIYAVKKKAFDWRS